MSGRTASHDKELCGSLVINLKDKKNQMMLNLLIKGKDAFWAFHNFYFSQFIYKYLLYLILCIYLI